MNDALRLLAVREAGAVTRCHTTPHLGVHDVAQHSWGVAAIVAILHPNPSAELLKACLFHDVAERWTGDVPYPMKRYAGDHDPAIEEAIHDKLKLPWQLSSPEDRLWLKAADLLDFYLWCVDQNRLGNRNVGYARRNTYLALTRGESVPKPIREAAEYFGSTEFHRLPDCPGEFLAIED